MRAVLQLMVPADFGPLHGLILDYVVPGTRVLYYFFFLDLRILRILIDNYYIFFKKNLGTLKYMYCHRNNQ